MAGRHSGCYCPVMRELLLRHNGLLASALSFILVIGGSVQILQNTLSEPAPKNCIQGLDTGIVIALSPWLHIKCRK